jgi:cytochrome c553
MKKITTSLVCVLACVASFNALAGGNIAAGKIAVETRTCGSCHGADMATPTDPSYPKLAGQYREYIAHALLTYQRGSEGANANGRTNPIMGAMAKQLSPKEIDDIAAYISSLPGPLVTEPESKFLHQGATN